MKQGRILISILLMMVMLSMTACGGSSSSTSSGSSQESASQEPYKISYVVSVRDEYLSKLEQAVRTAAVSRGVDLEILFAGEDSAKVVQCVETARESGRQAVLINMVNAEDAEACIEAAGDMKVVFINRVPADYSVLNDNVAAVASDENLSGTYQGEYLADYYTGAGQKEVSYVLLHGTPGLVHTDLRTSGAIDTVKAAGIDLKEAAVVEGNYDRQTAQNAMQEILDAGTKFDCVISNNDAMAIGAVEAMRNAGLDLSAIQVVGIDGTDDALTELKEGAINMTVHQSAEMQADGSIMAAVNMLSGKALTEGTSYEVSKDSEYVVYAPFEPITADNLSDYLK